MSIPPFPLLPHKCLPPSLFDAMRSFAPVADVTVFPELSVPKSNLKMWVPSALQFSSSFVLLLSIPVAFLVYQNTGFSQIIW
jgi:hypothetical protein